MFVESVVSNQIAAICCKLFNCLALYLILKNVVHINV